MKRRALAWLGLVLAAAGFVILAVSIWFNINFLIPVGMIFAAFIILTVVRKMPSDLPENDEKKDGGENAKNGAGGNE